ncbi:MAG TPA: PstS family phosphate ABC transporter substrate-binding protein [Abditibacteriaceae bacterium]|jgi:phosphate transport system substrate-binding protein
MYKQLWKLGIAGVLAAGLVGCGSQGGEGGEGSGKLAGTIKGDGSSTVYPITEAVAEEFGKAHPDLKITVGVSGTGGGFKKFIAGDTVLQNASRPIKDKESKSAQEKGIEYIELPVAYDALTVVVNPKNTWATDLTVAELKKIWEPGSKVKNWSQVRAGFPNKPLKLYGPGTDSGTFDYFTEAINGEEDKCRTDFVSSEDDNVLVQGVQREEGALGYFGLAYYEENKGKLKAVKVNGVEPSAETVNDGKYKPLARPLFIYIEKKAAARPEVNAFVKFYLTEGRALVKETGYVPMPDELYEAALKRFEEGKTGTMYEAKDAKKKPLKDLMGS